MLHHTEEPQGNVDADLIALAGDAVELAAQMAKAHHIPFGEALGYVLAKITTPECIDV